MKGVKGYKVFNPDWTCNGKQYTCPGKFEENVKPFVCSIGMHFCKKVIDCFNHYEFNENNHVAEVIAYGEVAETNNKCCTDKIEIVREIPWAELLGMVNIGVQCAGLGNSGNYNSGNYNSGDFNSGNRNTGDCNSGDYNSGDRNSGSRNSGDWNSGNWNSGNRNIGDCNSGDWNDGNRNSGDWNECNFSNGCFNTDEPKIYLFDEPSEWTYRDWLHSEAHRLMNQIPSNLFKYVLFEDMTDEEKVVHPEAETIGGYQKRLCNSECAGIWWRELSDEEKNIIMSIPNFNKIIFKRITGIDVDAD